MAVDAHECADLAVDGGSPLCTGQVAAVNALCDRVEDGAQSVAVVRVGGVPAAVPVAGIGLLTKWEGALRRLERLPALTVAAVSGPCGGLALDVLLAADFRVAFDEQPAVRLVPTTAGGRVWPGMAVHRLGRASRSAPVRLAVLLGAPIGLDEAVASGLIDQVAQPKQVPDVIRALGRQVAGGGADLAVRRALLEEAGEVPFEDALGAHLAACDRVLRAAPAT